MANLAQLAQQALHDRFAVLVVTKLRKQLVLIAGQTMPSLDNALSPSVVRNNGIFFSSRAESGSLDECRYFPLGILPPSSSIGDVRKREAKVPLGSTEL